MGLLDDAIREHLELKRRRGADPAEVEQQEREALGPVGGGRTAAPAQAPVAEPPETPHAPREPEDLAPRPAVDREPPPPHADPDPAPRHHDAVRTDDPPPPAEEPPPPPPPAAAAPPPQPAAPEPVSQPTEQYSVEDLEALRRDAEAEDVVPADEEPGAEDVLDETPDFLQEAPEHDRLWFEQRPPRDFDF